MGFTHFDTTLCLIPTSGGSLKPTRQAYRPDASFHASFGPLAELSVDEAFVKADQMDSKGPVRTQQINRRNPKREGPTK